MRIVQFEIPELGRRVGVVEGNSVRDLTSVSSGMTHVHEVFLTACNMGKPLADLLSSLAATADILEVTYEELLATPFGTFAPFLHPPLDHKDPNHVLITGTGLTHTGSMQSRDEMHTQNSEADDEPKTDSAKMFDMGLEGGKPADGKRGIAPEWFYKGNGTNLKGPNDSLELPHLLSMVAKNQNWLVVTSSIMTEHHAGLGLLSVTNGPTMRPNELIICTLHHRNYEHVQLAPNLIPILISASSPCNARSHATAKRFTTAANFSAVRNACAIHWPTVKTITSNTHNIASLVMFISTFSVPAN